MLARISHEHFYETSKTSVKAGDCLLRNIVMISPKYSPKVSPCDAIFFSILPVNIEHYDLQVKTLKLTPPELMKNPG